MVHGGGQLRRPVTRPACPGPGVERPDLARAAESARRGAQERVLLVGVLLARSGLAGVWNGRAWRTWSRQTSLCPISQGPCFTNDVSCGSATSCVAVGAVTNTGGSQQVVIGFRWQRTHWAQFKVQLPFDGNPANAYQVSCAGRFCMAVGGAFQETANGDVAAAATWNGQGDSWTDASPKLGIITCKTGFQPCGWTRAISCGSPANCMTITVAHGNQAWNGTAWKAAPFAPAGRAAALDAVSCHAASCLAVGHATVSGRQSTLAEFWNGTAWKVVPTPR